jgi:hypothetical protein
MPIINSGSGFFIGRRFDVQLSAELRHKGDPIFERFFEGTDPEIVNLTENTFLIPNHFFRTGEEIRYEYEDFFNDSDNAIGVAETSITGVGIGITRLPQKLYAVVLNDRFIQVAATKDRALKRIPEVFDLNSTGFGTFHKFIGEKQNTRSLITIDNVIQTPSIDTEIKTQLTQTLPGSSDLLNVVGITSFFNGDLIRVNNEIMRIDLVGIGNRQNFVVRRPLLGTGISSHQSGSDVVKLTGNYQVVDNIIYFPVPPFEKSPTTDFERKDPLDRDYIGIETFSTFDGRVFLRSGFEDSNIGPYDRNYLLDDISNQFLGISTQAVLKQRGEDVTGFSTGNALVLVNNVFQTPDFIDYGLRESAGITTISFTGRRNSNPEDINTASIPRGGIIVSVGTTEGYGYQPLVAAGGTAIISDLGSVESVSIGYTGSGYRSPEKRILKTRINHPTYNPAVRPAGEFSDRFFIEDQNGVFKKLDYFINDNPSAICKLSVQNSVGLNYVTPNDFAKIVSIGNTYVVIESPTDAWSEIFDSSSFNFLYATNATQASIGSTDRVRVASVIDPSTGVGIDTSSRDFYVTIGSVAVNTKIISADLDNRIFTLESPTTGPFVNNSSVVVNTFTPGVTQTNISDIVYIEVTNPNINIIDVYLNTDREFSVVSAPYTNTTGIVTITAPGFRASKDELVELRGFVYTCTSGGSFNGPQGSFNKRVGIQSITVNAKFFDIFDATYDPVTGISTLTIGTHSLLPGERIFIEPESLGFSCTLDNNQTITYYPRESDPAYNKTLEIISVTSDTIEVNVGSGGGDTSQHTFEEVNPIIVNPVRYSTGIVTFTTDGNQQNTLNPNDLVLFNDTETILDEKIFTVQSSPITFGSFTNAFEIDVNELSIPSPKQNILNSLGSFVLATIILPSGKFGFEFNVLDVLGLDTFVLDVGTAPLKHDYLKGGVVKNIARSKTPVHIGVSTTKNGSISNVDITNTGIGFTQYNLFANYNLSSTGIQGSTTIVLGNVIGINTFRDYVKIGDDGDLIKIIAVDPISKVLTLESPLPTIKAPLTKVDIYRYDDLNLNFEDPLSYQNLSLVYSPKSVQGIGSYAKANVTIGNDGRITEFELLTSGYSYGQGEILTIPTGGITGVQTFFGDQITGISTSVGILTGSISTFNDRFGYAVDINFDGSSVIVGSPFGKSEELRNLGIGTASGIAYIFDKDGDEFNQVGILTGEYSNIFNENFGFSVAMSGDGNTIVVGSPNDENPENAGIASGQVYIFNREPGPVFNPVGILSGSSAQAFSFYGWDVDLSDDGNTLVVGARRNRAINQTLAGLVYVYEKNNGSFEEIALLDGGSNATLLDEFGYSVSISPDGNFVAVGAIFDEDTTNVFDDFGLVYVFERDGNNFNQVGILTSPKLASNKSSNDKFGYSVDISENGNVVAVGALNDSSIIGGTNTGLVYVFEKINNTYYPVQVLEGKYSTESDDNFGYSLSVSNDGTFIAVGAINDEKTILGLEESSGIVYLYERRTFNYLGSDYANIGIQTGIYANHLNDNYGSSVAISGDKNSFIVGAQYDELSPAGIGTYGVSYVYNTTIGSTFEEFEVLVDRTFTDDFSGYVFGDLIVFDDISRLFNGRRREFPFRLRGIQTSLRARPGSTLELEYNLLIFINDIYQVPNQAYFFEGGSTFRFSEPPTAGDKCVIVFYYGTTEIDTRLVDILETIKIGDNVTVNSQNFSLQQRPRTVTNIRSTDIIETNTYTSPGVTDDINLERPVKWCKQLVDKIIDGNVVGKSRKPYEPEIYPKSQIIKSVGIGSTESIFVESLKTFFDSDDEYENIGINKKPQQDIIIISNDVGIAASANVTVGSNLRISSISLENPGIGYLNPPDISISLPNFIGIGTTDNERAEASCTIDSQGRINSISLINPGYGYTTSGISPIVFIGSPGVKYEEINEVFYEGDFGWITGIGTTSGNREPISEIGIITGRYASNLDDNFGSSIATSSDGSIIVVGAYKDELEEDDPNLDYGLVYVYERNSNVFNEVGILTGTYSFNKDDFFGWDVDVSGDGNTIVVSAIRDETDDPSYIPNSGLLYVFERDGGSYIETNILTGSRMTNQLQLAWSVSISEDGNTIVAGCKFAGIPLSSGLVYVYKRQEDGSFEEVQVLTGSTSIRSGDNFGNSVAINSDGSIIVVGANNAGEVSLITDNAGRVYVFKLINGTYVETSIIAPDLIENAQDFGHSVAIANETNTIVVGDLGGKITETSPSSGIAYIYDQLEDGSYSLIRKISGSFAINSADSFGSSVKISSNGRTIVIGALQDETPETIDNVGTVYVFNRTGNTIDQVEVLTGSYENDALSLFGKRVGLSKSGDIIVVGAEGGEDPNSQASSGVVYVYENPTPDTFERNFVFELYITEDSFLRDSTIGDPISESKIESGYYFRINKSNVGNVGFGITSLDIFDGTKKLFDGDKFLDGVYQVSSVSIARTEVPGLVVGAGRTDIIRVTVPVESYNGLDISSGGFIGNVGSGYTYGQYFGDYSWGRMSNLKRTKLLSFNAYNNGDSGISTSPSVIRISPLKSEGYTPNFTI